MTGPRIVFVVFPELQSLDLCGPMEVFATATGLVEGATYRTDVVSGRGGPVRTSSGLEISSAPIASVHAPIDTLVVVGGDGTRAAVQDEDLLHHVGRLAAGARRVTSVCSGAFVLAVAGLLDGRRATTHWSRAEQLARLFPGITVAPDSIYVRDGNVWTSAGVTAGIDLALALVADDHGQQAAGVVARQLVVYLRRGGGQAQFSAPMAAQAAEHEPLRELLEWLPDHLDADLSVAALASRMHRSERQFTRVFKRSVGTTPADHVEAVRLEAACRLLETTRVPVERVALACGFGTPETLHRSFRRRFGTTPGNHRAHFAAAG